MENQNQNQKDFVVHAHTRIGWGKLKGQPHSAFLLPINKGYVKWIVDQGDEFRYTNTRKWIMENVNTLKELTPSEWEYLTSARRDLTPSEEDSVNHFNEFLLRIDQIND